MKILAIISTQAATNIIRPEAEQFIAMHKRGIRLDIICHKKSEYAKRFLNAGMRIVGEFPDSKNDKNAIKAIRQLLIDEKYDILHALHRKSIACGLKASKGLPVKIVAYRGASGLYWHDPSAYENALNPRVAKVICVCDTIRRNISKQLFFKSKKAVTVYKGHMMEWYKDISKADLGQLHIPKDALLITCPANNRKWKGIPTFLDAFHSLPEDANIHVLLVGSGMDTPFYQKKIDQNKNKDKIHVLGYRHDILNILAASHLVMQTSYKNEGLSRSTIEGMSQGVVPIVTDAGGNPELVLNDKCGLVVPIKQPKAMAKAILRLYKDDSLRAQFSEAAKNRIRTHFTVDKTAEDTMKIYQDLLLNKQS